MPLVFARYGCSKPVLGWILGLQGLGSDEGSLEAAAQGGPQGSSQKGQGGARKEVSQPGWQPRATYTEREFLGPSLCWASWGWEGYSVTINLPP